MSSQVPRHGLRRRCLLDELTIGCDPLEVATMPRGSSPKRERQYEHIKDSYEDRGVSADEAEERAARTVNKQRAEHGETKASSKKS
jgi:hypothetical protein